MDRWSLLSADSPLTDPAEDMLGHAAFAERLADALRSMSPVEGLVVAVHGPWGSGKSTVLNFVQCYLEREAEEERPTIVRFNPWWFSGQEALTRRFFGQLEAQLKAKPLREVRQKLAELSEIVSELPAPGGIKALAWLGRRLSREKDLPDLKESIRTLLKKQDHKILVLADDIDRLTSDEICQLFKLVRAVANFPNVLYLLAFDRDVVVQALEREQPVSGEGYLEKIVQVPFELPLPDKSALRRLLFSRLDEVLRQAGLAQEDFDRIRWTNVYHTGIDPFIITPRSIVRLVNALQVTYATVKDEVDPVDFMAIESLRLFCPSGYGVVRANRDRFAGVTSPLVFAVNRTAEEEERSFHEGWIGELADHQREPVKRLLSLLFPRFARTGGRGYPSRGEVPSGLGRRRSICVEDAFPVYFRLAVPEGAISNMEMRAHLASMSDSDVFEKTLLRLVAQTKLDGTTRVGTFLERLEDYTEEDIPEDHIPEVVRAFFNVGDQLLREEDARAFELDNRLRVARVLRQLLQRLGEPKRYALLRSVVGQGKSLHTVVYEVTLAGQEHGKYGGDERVAEASRLVSSDHLAELEEIAVRRIRRAGQESVLLQVPRLPLLLRRWQDWSGNSGEAREWAGKVAETDEGLIALLEGFLDKTSRQPSGSLAVETQPRLDPKWLEPYLEPDAIIGRVRSLMAGDGLTERQRTALVQFAEEYDLRAQGYDPDDAMW